MSFSNVTENKDISFIVEYYKVENAEIRTVGTVATKVHIEWFIQRRAVIRPEPRDIVFYLRVFLSQYRHDQKREEAQSLETRLGC